MEYGSWFLLFAVLDLIAGGISIASLVLRGIWRLVSLPFSVVGWIVSGQQRHKQPHRVAVVGSAFCGLTVARELQPLVDSGEVEVCMIDSKPYFEYTPGILRALVEPEHAARIQRPLSQVIGSARLQVGSVVDIDVNGSSRGEKLPTPAGFVTVVRGPGLSADLRGGGPARAEGGRQRSGSRPGVDRVDGPVVRSVVKVPFDSLVVAAGSDYEAPMKANHVAASGEDRRAALRRSAEAIRGVSREEGLLVVGGGAVGVELTAEMVHARGGGQGITLVHSGGALLSQLGQPSMGEAAERWLAERGVDVVLGERVVEGPGGFDGAPGRGLPARIRARSMAAARAAAGLYLQAQGALDSQDDASVDEDFAEYASGPAGTYVTSSGRKIRASLCYKCVGSLRNLEFLDGGAAQESFAHSKRWGRLAVDGNMQVLGVRAGGQMGGAGVADGPRPLIFAGGDCAVQEGSPDLMLAHSAEMQGHVIAHRIAHAARQQGGHAAGRAGSGASTPVPGGGGDYPAALTGRPSLALPRIAIISLGPYEALLCMNDLVLADPVGRRLAAFAKVMIEWSKMLQAAGDVTGWAIWAFGDWAALLLNATLLPPGHGYSPAGGSGHRGGGVIEKVRPGAGRARTESRDPTPASGNHSTRYPYERMATAFGPVSGESRVAFILSQFPEVPGTARGATSKGRIGMGDQVPNEARQAQEHLAAVREAIFSMLRVQPQASQLDALATGFLHLPPSTVNEAVSSCIVGAARRHHRFNPKKGTVEKMKGSAAAAMGWLGRKLFGHNGDGDDGPGEKAAAGSGPGEGGRSTTGWDSRRASTASATSAYGAPGGPGDGNGTFEGDDCGDCRDWSRPKVYASSVPPELPRDFLAGPGRPFSRFSRPRVRPVPASGPSGTAVKSSGGSAGPEKAPGGASGRAGSGSGAEGAVDELEAPVETVDYPDLRLARYAVALQCDASDDEEAAALKFDFSALRASPSGGGARPGLLPESEGGPEAGRRAGGIAAAAAGRPRQRKRTLSQEDIAHVGAKRAVAVAAVARPPRAASPTAVDLPPPLSPTHVEPDPTHGLAGLAGGFSKVRLLPAVRSVAMHSPVVPAGHWVSVRLRVRNSGAGQAAARCRRLLDVSIPPECLGVLEGAVPLEADDIMSVASSFAQREGRCAPAVSRTCETEHACLPLQVRAPAAGLTVDGHGGRGTLRLECKLREPGAVGSALLALQVVGGLSVPLLVHLRTRRAARHAPLERLPWGQAALPHLPELQAVAAMRRRSVASRRATAVSASAALERGCAGAGEHPEYHPLDHQPACRVPVPSCFCALWARVLEVPSGLTREGLFRTAASRDSRVRLRALVDSAAGCGLPDSSTVDLPPAGGEPSAAAGSQGGEEGALGEEGEVLLQAIRHVNASPVACAGEIKSLLRDLPRRLLDPPLRGLDRRARAGALRRSQARLGTELTALEAGLAMLEQRYQSEREEREAAAGVKGKEGKGKGKARKKVGFAGAASDEEEEEDEENAGTGEATGSKAGEETEGKEEPGAATERLDPGAAAAAELSRVAIAAVAAAAGVDFGVWDRVQGEAMAEARRSTELRDVAREALLAIDQGATGMEGGGQARGGGRAGSLEEAMLEGAVERRGTPGGGKASGGAKGRGNLRGVVPLFKVEVGQGMPFLRGLGKAQARVLLWLVQVVRQVCARSAENRMSVRAMGIVLGPNLMTPPVMSAGGTGREPGLGAEGDEEGQAMGPLDGELDTAWEDDEADPAESLASARRCARLLELLAAC